MKNLSVIASHKLFVGGEGRELGGSAHLTKIWIQRLKTQIHCAKAVNLTII